MDYNSGYIKAIIIIIMFFLISYYKYLYKKNQFANKFINKKYINEMNYVKNLKKVVYTALLGKYDVLHSIVKEVGYDYFMFTDQPFNNESNINWTILHIDNESKNLNSNIIKKQRFFKTHPHLFFPNYDLSIYIDSTFEIKGKLDEFLLRVLSPKLSIYVLEHPERNSVNNELKIISKYHRDKKQTLDIIQNKYNNENFTDDNGLAECCLIIRKHNDINCINYMNNWYNEIKLNSHRDQLSFNYILWKKKNKYVKYISKYYINKYFTQYPIHLVYL